jgi:putative ABC transport system permease protein
MVIAKSADYVDQITDTIRDMYGDDIRVFSVKVAVNIARNILSSVNMILVSVASISVLVAFIGIMTTMFTSTVERTREIGLLKALGFSRKDVLVLFLSESTLMGMIGGLGGSACGVVLAYILSYLFTFRPIRGTYPGSATAVIHAQPLFTPEIILMAFLLATMVGAIAGLIPAWRASKLVPVEALRYE